MISKLLIAPQSVLGKKLAKMHKAGKSSKGFGFDVDNTIGRYDPYAHGHSNIYIILMCSSILFVSFSGILPHICHLVMVFQGVQDSD